MHSVNENMTPIYYERILFVSHFNAGVRAVDIHRDPYHPKEVELLHSGGNAAQRTRAALSFRERREPLQNRRIQTNNVEVDDRGYIYITDRANNGLHILELTGQRRAHFANFPP